MQFKTADLCDQFSADVDVCDPVFRDFGGVRSFAGPIATIKCFEDNSRVREIVTETGGGRVLVVDAGGSTRCAVLGDILAQKALAHGWAGALIFGSVRDAATLATLPLGVKAIATSPLKTAKRNEGQRDVPLRFAGAEFHPGDWLYADEDGVIVARRALV